MDPWPLSEKVRLTQQIKAQTLSKKVLGSIKGHLGVYVYIYIYVMYKYIYIYIHTKEKQASEDSHLYQPSKRVTWNPTNNMSLHQHRLASPKDTAKCIYTGKD